MGTKMTCIGTVVLAATVSALTADTLPSDWKTKMTFAERMVAGAAARGVAQTSLHPIDVLRTRLQAKGVAVAFTPRVLMKGVAPQFVLAFPAGAVQFAAYEFCKARAAAAQFTGGAAEVLCGAAGALAASVIRVPQEVLKQRVQADIYPNAVVGFSKLMGSEGPAGFYKGYTATISRDVPWNALSFLFFAQSKAAFTKVTGEAPSMKDNLVLGALSGMVAAAIMTPVDVVKTRLMTGGASGGILGTAAAILREEGAGTLMKGLLPRIAYLAPMASLTLSFYESFGKALLLKRLQAEAA
mmetsp:Transcript_60124/g.137876  ORF Transcript_60124/g.137876 Transcript_60124/m.137876 type:complete len:298 (-) Transcript_60124:201-1094(-)